MEGEESVGDERGVNGQSRSWQRLCYAREAEMNNAWAAHSRHLCRHVALWRNIFIFKHFHLDTLSSTVKLRHHQSASSVPLAGFLRYIRLLFKGQVSGPLKQQGSFTQQYNNVNKFSILFESKWCILLGDQIIKTSGSIYRGT